MLNIILIAIAVISFIFTTVFTLCKAVWCIRKLKQRRYLRKHHLKVPRTQVTFIDDVTLNSRRMNDESKYESIHFYEHVDYNDLLKEQQAEEQFERSIRELIACIQEY